MFILMPRALVWEMDVLGEWGISSGGCAISGTWVTRHTAHVARSDDALQWPQHDDHQEYHENDEEQQSFPVCQPIQDAQGAGPGLSGGLAWLAGPDVDADTEGGGGSSRP